MEILVMPIDIMPRICDEEGGGGSGGCVIFPCSTKIPCDDGCVLA